MTSEFNGVQFTVARHLRKTQDPADPLNGMSSGLWQWTVGSIIGLEASQAAAINAAQEQCGMLPSKRKTDYTPVPF